MTISSWLLATGDWQLKLVTRNPKHATHTVQP